MGCCAYGKFVPTPAYGVFQQHCIRHREMWRASSWAIVNNLKSACFPPYTACILYVNAPELGSEGIELHLLGINTQPYAESFQTISRIASPFNDGSFTGTRILQSAFIGFVGTSPLLMAIENIVRVNVRIFYIVLRPNPRLAKSVSSFEASAVVNFCKR